MTPPRPPAEPWPYLCRDGHHKVITADRICVICGAKNVTDARQRATGARADAAPAAGGESLDGDRLMRSVDPDNPDRQHPAGAPIDNDAATAAGSE